MTKTTAMTKDPICGMTVDEASALHAERDGKTFYFSAGKSFCPRPQGRSPMKRLVAVAGNTRAHWPATVAK